MSKPTGNWEDDLSRGDTAKFVRRVPKADPALPTIEKLRLIVKECQANRVNGVFVDLWTASVITQVYDAVNEENKAKLTALPVRKMAEICFRLTSGGGR